MLEFPFGVSSSKNNSGMILILSTLIPVSSLSSLIAQSNFDLSFFFSYFPFGNDK
jgi:hypothetical protein